MPIAVTRVEYLDGYRLKLTFSSGEAGIADLADLVRRAPGAEPIRDVEAFRHVQLDEWPTVAWPCGFALAPELAYRLATGKEYSWPSETSPAAA